MLYALILAGGKGTRLYPLSREDNPKQFLKVINDKSFLRSTVDRILKLIPRENIYVVTNERYLEKVKEELDDIKEENIFTEPQNKETATCIALSAVKLVKNDKDAKMVVLPSDHYIQGEREYLDTIQRALDISEKRRGLVTIGIKPTRPETGYGYIKVGDRVNNKIGTFRVEQFIEKPNLEVATDFYYSNNYLWNSGMFVWRADVFLRELERYVPKMYKNMMEIYKAVNTKEEKVVIEDQYNLIEGISVDYGIMQKTRKAYVIESEFIWDDIGNFNSLGKFLSNQRSNGIKGEVFTSESENCFVFGGKKFIITFGVEDLIIVDSEDVLLIMSKDKDQDLKHLVDIIKQDDKFNKYI